MGDDTPRPERHWKDRGFGAKTSHDPTLASYLSSILYLLALPTFIILAYAGFYLDLYAYDMIIPVLAGMFVVLVVAAFTAMHVFTDGN